MRATLTLVAMILFAVLIVLFSKISIGLTAVLALIPVGWFIYLFFKDTILKKIFIVLAVPVSFSLIALAFVFDIVMVR